MEWIVFAESVSLLEANIVNVCESMSHHVDIVLTCLAKSPPIERTIKIIGLYSCSHSDMAMHKEQYVSPDKAPALLNLHS